jgi:hypothetical protein
MAVTTIDPTKDTMQLAINGGDNLWTRLMQNVDGLQYSESELRASPELFVWISVNNGVIDNFRNISPRTLTVPKRSVLDTVVILVRSDSTTYPPKYFEWVDMDRCVGQT